MAKGNKIQTIATELILNRFDISINETLLLMELKTLITTTTPNADMTEAEKAWLNFSKLLIEISQFEDLLRSTIIKKDINDLIHSCTTVNTLKEFLDFFGEFESVSGLPHHVTIPFKHELNLIYFDFNSKIRTIVEALEKNAIKVSVNDLDNSIEVSIPREIQVLLGGIRMTISTKGCLNIITEYRENQKNNLKALVDLLINRIVVIFFNNNKFHYSAPSSAVGMEGSKTIVFKRVLLKDSDELKRFNDTLDSLIVLSHFVSENLFDFNKDQIKTFGKAICGRFCDKLKREFLINYQWSDHSGHQNLAILREWEPKMFAAGRWIEEDFVNSNLLPSFADLLHEKNWEQLLSLVRSVLNSNNTSLQSFDLSVEESAGTLSKGKSASKGKTVSIYKDLFGPCRISTSTAIVMDLVYEQVLLSVDRLGANKESVLLHHKLARGLVLYWIGEIGKRNDRKMKCCIYTDSLYAVYKLSKFDSIYQERDAEIHFTDLCPFIIRLGQKALIEVVREVTESFERDFDKVKVKRELNEVQDILKYILPESDYKRVFKAILEEALRSGKEKYNNQKRKKEEELELKYFIQEIETQI